MREGALSYYSVLRTQLKVVLFCGKCFVILSHSRPLNIAQLVSAYFDSGPQQRRTHRMRIYDLKIRDDFMLFSCFIALLQWKHTLNLSSMLDPGKKLGGTHQCCHCQIIVAIRRNLRSGLLMVYAHGNRLECQIQVHFTVNSINRTHLRRVALVIFRTYTLSPHKVEILVTSMVGSDGTSRMMKCAPIEAMKHGLRVFRAQQLAGWLAQYVAQGRLH